MKLLSSIKWHFKRVYKKVLYFLQIAINPVIQIAGVKLIMDKNWSFNVKDHMIRKDYETGEIEIIKKNLDSTDIVLEIGTGLGFIAIYCSKIVGQENVTSVEANPFLESYHTKVFNLNNIHPNVIYNSVGKEEAETTFYIDKKNFWSSSLIPFKSKNLLNIQVKNINVNNLIRDISPTFLIIDVEGFEYELISMIKDYQGIKKIQIETHPQIIGLSKVEEIIPALSKYSFELDEYYSKENQFFFKKA
ncbi:MAG: FkbM family methyltransferase [Bacteroidales bacterium]|nr:FkbM family methyltransferase [Bacteroidales bacterium]